MVDESKAERSWLQQALSGVARLETCGSPSAALEVLGRVAVDLVVWGMPDDAGLGTRLVSRLHREHPSVDMVLLARESAAESLRSEEPAAAFVLSRPADSLELRRVVEQALLRRRLADENRSLEERVETVERCRRLIPCLDPGEVYPTALDLLLELLERRRGIALFRRAWPRKRRL